MKQWMKKGLAVCLALVMCLALAACGGKEDETPAEEPVNVRVAALKGPTAMGMVKLMSDSDAAAESGEETIGNTYEFTLAASADEVSPKLMQGELDIACVPANLASVLYNRTEGGIVTLAVNTLGVLYIVENGNAVASMADLAGKTIYSINQGTNTEYVLNYLLEESGLTPGEDVTIEWKTSEEVTALMASGGIDLCMLPVPAATSVMMQNADVRDAIDLNDVWQDVGAAGTFTMGCVVARSDFVEEHPEAVDAFLTEYAASIAYVNEHPEEAAALVEQYGIVPKAAVAKAAIPQANMVCLTGDELKGISDYYEVLYAADPTSIGGAIPDDNFYYIP